MRVRMSHISSIPIAFLDEISHRNVESGSQCHFQSLHNVGHGFFGLERFDGNPRSDLVFSFDIFSKKNVKMVMHDQFTIFFGLQELKASVSKPSSKSKFSPQSFLGRFINGFILPKFAAAEFLVVCQESPIIQIFSDS